MKENDVIVLDNNERYSLSKEVIYEDEKYFLAYKADEKCNMIDNDIKFFKVVTENGENYVELIRNPNTILELTRLIKE